MNQVGVHLEHSSLAVNYIHVVLLTTDNFKTLICINNVAGIMEYIRVDEYSTNKILAFKLHHAGLMNL